MLLPSSGSAPNPPDSISQGCWEHQQVSEAEILGDVQRYVSEHLPY